MVASDVRMPVPGALLATDVVVGADGSDPKPALLIRTPYSRAVARDAYDLVGLARAGWGVVLQDARGRFDSSGTFDPFVQEAADGRAAAEWCASQAWCDGTVAMTGMSYLGWAQWAAAGDPPASLRALNPVLAPARPPEEWLWDGGAFAVALAQTWALGVVASSTGPGWSDDQRRLAGELAGDWPNTMRAPASKDPVAELLPAYARWRSGGAGAGAVAPTHAAPVGVPSFQVAGWYDPFCESGLRAHAAQAAAGTSAMTVVGPWAHNERLSNLYPELDFGPLGNGEMAGVIGEGLTWMRSVIAGGDVPTGVRYFVMGAPPAAQWRVSPSWPPSSRELRMFLDADGGLSPRPPANAWDRVLLHDPSDPVPTWGGRTFGPYLPLAGPVDQRPVESRPDVAVWTSPPLPRGLTIAGEVFAELRFDCDARTADLAVNLSDVHPDGRSFNVVDGIARVDRVPSAGGVCLVSLGSTAQHFAEGHRVRLRVSTSNFPRYDVNPDRLATLTLQGRELIPCCLVLPEV